MGWDIEREDRVVKEGTVRPGQLKSGRYMAASWSMGTTFTHRNTETSSKPYSLHKLEPGPSLASLSTSPSWLYWYTGTCYKLASLSTLAYLCQVQAGFTGTLEPVTSWLHSPHWHTCGPVTSWLHSPHWHTCEPVTSWLHSPHWHTCEPVTSWLHSPHWHTCGPVTSWLHSPHWHTCEPVTSWLHSPHWHTCEPVTSWLHSPHWHTCEPVTSWLHWYIGTCYKLASLSTLAYLCQVKAGFTPKHWIFEVASSLKIIIKKYIYIYIYIYIW